MALQMEATRKVDLELFRDMVSATAYLNDEDLDRLNAIRGAMPKDKSTR